MRKCLPHFIHTICFKLKFVQLMDRYITNNPLWGEISDYGLKLKTGIYIFFTQRFWEDENGTSYKKVVFLQ